jgi:hypothetical protein
LRSLASRIACCFDFLSADGLGLAIRTRRNADRFGSARPRLLLRFTAESFLDRFLDIVLVAPLAVCFLRLFRPRMSASFSTPSSDGVDFSGLSTLFRDAVAVIENPPIVSSSDDSNEVVRQCS